MNAAKQRMFGYRKLPMRQLNFVQMDCPCAAHTAEEPLAIYSDAIAMMVAWEQERSLA